MSAMRNILVPTDFSEPAHAALDYARTLARQFDGRVHLLHVIATAQIGWAIEGSAASWPNFLLELETEAWARLGQLVPPGDPLFGLTTVEVVTGTPVEQILAYGAEHQIDLIVMGTHGRGLIGHMFLGSVAERVVRRATVPVLTVHAARLTRTRPEAETFAAAV